MVRPLLGGVINIRVFSDNKNLVIKSIILQAFCFLQCIQYRSRVIFYSF